MSLIPVQSEEVQPEELLAAFPEFGEVPVEAVRFQLALAAKKQSRAAWGGYWRFAVILAAAHELSLSYDVAAGLAGAGKKDAATVGFTTAVSAAPGSLSESMAFPAWMTGDDVIDSHYGRSAYGRQYLLMLIEVVPGGSLVVSPQISDFIGF